VKAPESSRPDDPLALLRTTEPPPETPKQVIKQLGIALVVAALVLGIYAWQTRRAHAVKRLVAEAVPLVEKGDLLSLRKAEEKYKEAIDAGSSPAAVAGIAEVYALLWVDHRVVEAKASAQENTSEAVDDDTETSQRFSAEGLVAVGEGRAADAEKLLSGLVERGAVTDRIFYALGMAEMAQGKAKAAKDHLKRAHDMRSQSPHYGRALGDAQDEAYDNRAASFAWEDAAKSNPAYVQGVARDLVARLRRGEPRKTVIDTIKMMKSLPADQVGPAGTAALAYTESVMHFIAADAKKARETLDEAVKLDGESARYLALRGLVQIQDGKNDEGIKHLVAAYTKAPQADRYLYMLADAYMDIGKPEDAVKTLLTAGTTRAEEAGYHIQLGYAYVAKGDHAKAKASFEKAGEVEGGEFADALLGLGVSLWKQKKYSDAVPFFERAVAAKPKYPEVYEGIGLMFAEQGALGQANPQLDMSEKLFRATDADPARMKRFYTGVIKSLSGLKGGSSLAKEWAGREKAYREGTQAPLP
jgi:tetratricopeptide (TPR) repeat protein